MPDRPEAPTEPLDRRQISNDTDGYRAAIRQMGVEPPKGGGPAALTLSPMTAPKKRKSARCRIRGGKLSLSRLSAEWPVSRTPVGG